MLSISSDTKNNGPELIGLTADLQHQQQSPILAQPATSSSVTIRQLFCSNSSLRGVPKICRADTVFLRVLWLVFVLTMFVLLVYSSTRVLMNYREYDVSVQTSVVANDPSEFPAITICGHYPFSPRASALWEQQSRRLSPANFNRRLRQLTLKLLFSGNMRLANTLLFYDKVNTFYQNLDPNVTISMGRSVEEFLLHCMIAIGNYVMVGKARECQLTFQLVSHPKYFNCYTVKPVQVAKSRAMSAVYLILNLGADKRQQHWEQAFVMDVFDQAYGLRLLLHEANLYPGIENAGVHVEPGKMVEVAFDTVLWKETKDSPNDPCHDSREPKIDDLNNRYDYSYQACKESHMNSLFIARCNCLLSRLPRPSGLPSNEIPYCGDFRNGNISIIESRLRCLEEIGEYLNSREHQESQQQQQQGQSATPPCHKRCTRYSYEQELSITRWRASNYQLHWMLDQSQSWKQLREAGSSSNGGRRNETERRRLLKRILDYLEADNLTRLPASDEQQQQQQQQQQHEAALSDNEANYAYVVIRRKSFDTLKREEKLTVTFEALMSRVGGLCSLYLGLTMAFFVEIVEFLYLVCLRGRGSGGAAATGRSS